MLSTGLHFASESTVRKTTRRPPRGTARQPSRASPTRSSASANCTAKAKA
jgi:hypothetical protein